MLSSWWLREATLFEAKWGETFGKDLTLIVRFFVIPEQILRLEAYCVAGFIEKKLSVESCESVEGFLYHSGWHYINKACNNNTESWGSTYQISATLLFRAFLARMFLQLRTRVGNYSNLFLLVKFLLDFLSHKIEQIFYLLTCLRTCLEKLDS